MKWLAFFTSAVLALATQTAIAQSVEQEVTGEVVEARPDANELSIRVLESDDGRAERVGQTETYTVPPGTTIEVDEDFGAPAGATRARTQDVQLDDLMLGDRVVITFEESAEGRQATRVRQDGGDTGQQQQQQQQQTAQQGQEDDTFGAETQARDQLPRSASPLPLLALAGIGFALFAGVLRFRRRQ